MPTMLFGHLAVSALLHHYSKADLTTVMVAGIFPDAVDKTLCRVLHLTPNGRMYGHTLLSLGLSTAIVGLFRGRHIAWSWALGYFGHLVSDSHGFVPWLYPFVTSDFTKPTPSFGFLLWQLMDPKRIGIELALSVWAAHTLVRSGSGSHRHVDALDRK
jgi:hypothetical protein